MKLEISDPKNLLDISFINWLKVKIRDKIITDINPKKLINWDNYFNQNNVYKSIYKKRISTLDIIIAGANNLDFSKSESNFMVNINHNIYTPGLDRVKIATVCKLINFGDLENKGYPIFTDTFDYFAENIQTYVDRYLLGMF
ncbi:MAG: hypothetical protein J6R47_04440 [Acholeplasmatales bacterium]|nr:hypothetical protein [Acholeplasmatales bacterium]